MVGGLRGLWLRELPEVVGKVCCACDRISCWWLVCLESLWPCFLLSSLFPGSLLIRWLWWACGGALVHRESQGTWGGDFLLWKGRRKAAGSASDSCSSAEVDGCGSYSAMWTDWAPVTVTRQCWPGGLASQPSSSHFRFYAHPTKQFLLKKITTLIKHWSFLLTLKNPPFSPVNHPGMRKGGRGFLVFKHHRVLRPHNICEEVGFYYSHLKPKELGKLTTLSSTERYFPPSSRVHVYCFSTPLSPGSST